MDYKFWRDKNLINNILKQTNRSIKEHKVNFLILIFICRIV